MGGEVKAQGFFGCQEATPNHFTIVYGHFRTLGEVNLKKSDRIFLEFMVAEKPTGKLQLIPADSNADLFMEFSQRCGFLVFPAFDGA